MAADRSRSGGSPLSSDGLSAPHTLADEPTGALDTANGDALVALMRRLNQERGVTFVIVTHDLDLAATTNRVVRLRDGRVAADGPPPASAA